MAEDTTAPRGIGRWIQVRPGEGRALLYAFGYFFFVLASYYILRPVRDEMAVRSGVGRLSWLFMATFIVSLIIAPLYAGLVAKLRRGVFIPLVYGFLILNMVAFWAMLTFGIALQWAAMAFFVWLSVFAVFAVSVFWSFMSDLFASEQAKRLYPTIAAGGSLGGLAGSATVKGLVEIIGAANLLLVAAALLAIAVAFALRLDRMTEAVHRAPDKGTGGGWLAGLVDVVKDPYLRGIALWVSLLSLANTFAYFMQTDILGGSGLSSDERTALFATIDLTANTLILLIQFVLTRFALQKLGVGITLGLVALVFVGGFVSLAVAPTLAVLVVFQIAQRTGQFALSNPAREALFTVVPREDTYKAKNVIDNAVFRGSDVGYSRVYDLLHATAGFGISTIAWIGAPIAAVWFVLSLYLGRVQGRKAETPGDRHAT